MAKIHSGSYGSLRSAVLSVATMPKCQQHSPVLLLWDWCTADKHKMEQGTTEYNDNGAIPRN